MESWGRNPEDPEARGGRRAGAGAAEVAAAEGAPDAAPGAPPAAAPEAPLPAPGEGRFCGGQLGQLELPKGWDL